MKSATFSRNREKAPPLSEVVCPTTISNMQLCMQATCTHAVLLSMAKQIISKYLFLSHGLTTNIKNVLIIRRGEILAREVYL